MSQFYSVKESLSQFYISVVKNSKGIIPTEQKSVFLTLFFAIFSTITGVGIVVPLLPVYANDLGASGLYIGLIFGSFSLSRTFLLPYFGRLSDRKGRKPLIIAGLSIYTLLSIAFILSSRVETLILIRFVQGAGSAMIMPVVQAYVGEITPEGSESYSMGLFNLSMFLSLSLGPMMGGSIKEIFSLDTAFICMGAFSGIGLLLCIFFLPPVGQETARSSNRDIIAWSKLIKDFGLIRLFSFRYAYVACIGVIWTFLPLFADTTFNLPGSLIGLLATLGVFVSGVLSLPMGYAADRVNKDVMAVCGGVLSTVGMAMLFWASSFMDLLIGVSVFGFGGGISMPAIMGYAVIKGEEKKAMGSVMSIMTVAHSLGMLTGSMAAGFAVDFLSLRLSFLCGAGIMATGTFLFLMIKQQVFLKK